MSIDIADIKDALLSEEVCSFYVGIDCTALMDYVVDAPDTAVAFLQSTGYVITTASGPVFIREDDVLAWCEERSFGNVRANIAPMG